MPQHKHQQLVPSLLAMRQRPALTSRLLLVSRRQRIQATRPLPLVGGLLRHLLLRARPRVLLLLVEVTVQV